ncbi:hypothetical protein KIN20_020889 [Parelaphostrongylus tenuis]|uniref:Uncharacterized protein n=1 Tax=Parelaphostrongylus tenuis TaxID=148309 RepID=A0AAD5QTS9_PARTN|nr:hypothetical protein KIN20_020889 [Parelaphostrongylus tenuis]
MYQTTPIVCLLAAAPVGPPKFTDRPGPAATDLGAAVIDIAERIKIVSYSAKIPAEPEKDPVMPSTHNA